MFFNFDATNFSVSVANVIPWLGFQAMGLSTLPQNTTDFCKQAPPDDMPTDSDYALVFINVAAALATGALQRIGNAAKWDAFNQYCECAPSSGVGCTSRSQAIGWSPGSPSGSICGPTSYYLQDVGGFRTFPTGQHVVRLRTPGTVTTHDLQFDVYTHTGNEQCHTWPAGTELDFTYTAAVSDANWGLAFRDSGSRPLWLEGQTLTADYQNRADEPPCAGGGTAPVLPVGGNPPSGLPQPPSCTTATVSSICAGVDQLLQGLGVVQAKLGVMTNSIDPINYIDGSQYPNLTGTGEIPISRLLGMRVYVVTPPPGQPVLPGNPPYIWNCGWMAIANSDGVLEERRVVRSGMTWIPRNMKLATSFQWALTPGTVCTAIEIRPDQL